ncbi:type II toxin-antitoxin system Rv0910 family toxin [Mycobacterium sp. LTG2003]
MADVDVTQTSSATPEQAWRIASDLWRFDEWLTIFGGWRSEVPDRIQKGTKVSSCIKVKGFRNIIRWEVTDYDEPRRIQLHGSGRGGVKIHLDLTVEANHPGSLFRVHADLGGGVLGGPVGRLVAKVLVSDIRKSVENLAALTEAPRASR